MSVEDQSQLYNTWLECEIGTLGIVSSDHGIHTIFFRDMVDDTEGLENFIAHSIRGSGLHGEEAKKQLLEYFNGERREFDLLLFPIGTEFQKSVWRGLREIPYGQTRSYLEQAVRLGNRKAVRALASANGLNPLAIVIPCHRVIGSDGSLTGYRGGIWRKQWLLNFERTAVSGQLSLL